MTTQTDRITRYPRVSGVLLATFILLAAVGCSATRQARSVETSGFLGDYSQLQEGEGDQALLHYVNPKADFRRYTKIILEPIKVYPGMGDSQLGKMSQDDLQKLLNYFDAALRENLGVNYAFVTTKGPDVMRLRIALTESDSARVPLDVVSSVIPVGIAVSALKSVAVGKGTGVGEASAECELLDSQSGQRLGAWVDKRVGSKYTGRFDKFSRWRATKAAFDYWAERMGERLGEMRDPAKK